jgi:hypothetical protein
MEIKSLAEALSKAQGKINAPKKNKTAGFYDKKGNWREYCYADLADVLEAIKGPLSENALAITQSLGIDTAGGYGLKTTLHHSSGESIESWYPLPNPASEISPQAFGSELTYARRYSITALIMTAADEDDDGQKSEKANESKPKSAAPKQTPTQPKAASPVSPKQQPAPVTNAKQPETKPAPGTLEAMSNLELEGLRKKMWEIKVMTPPTYKKLESLLMEMHKRQIKYDPTGMPQMRAASPLDSPPPENYNQEWTP